MKHSLGRVAVVLVAVLVLSAIAVQAGSMYTTWTGRYKIGETVAFKIVDSGGGWWSCGQCNTCGQSQILGWHIADSSGQTIYTVVHDAPVPSSSWQGTWTQVDANGAAVAAGTYTLYVDTSVGTLTRFIKLYDPCNSCTWGWGWSCNTCQETATIVTNCYCRTSLVLQKETTTCGWPFWWPCCTPKCP